VVNQDRFYPPVIRETVQSGRPQRLNGLERGGALLDGAESQIVIPILRESDVMGVVLLESTRREGYPEEMLTFLTRLSDHAAMAIANAQLYQEVQAADQAKNDFISLVIHELKTPMTSIRGYTDLLQKGQLGPLNAAQTDFLNIIFSNVIRMDSLVSDLVDVSKIEEGRLRLEFSTVSLADAMGEVVRSMKEQIEGKNQALLVQVPEDLPVVWADQNRLVQVLTNLVSNAHKYTPDRGQICVQAEHTANQWDAEGATEVVHLVVQDTGFGIKPEDQGKIFQRFFRSEDDQVRAASGTGLGLNISKNLVEMQGGRIWFESEFGRGTAFHFTVPVAIAS
jgi:signal transduction histidine kinase